MNVSQDQWAEGRPFGSYAGDGSGVLFANEYAGTGTGDVFVMKRLGAVSAQSKTLFPGNLGHDGLGTHSNEFSALAIEPDAAIKPGQPPFGYAPEPVGASIRRGAFDYPELITRDEQTYFDGLIENDKAHERSRIGARLRRVAGVIAGALFRDRSNINEAAVTADPSQGFDAFGYRLNEYSVRQDLDSAHIDNPVDPDLVGPEVVGYNSSLDNAANIAANEADITGSSIAAGSNASGLPAEYRRISSRYAFMRAAESGESAVTGYDGASTPQTEGRRDISKIGGTADLIGIAALRIDTRLEVVQRLIRIGDMRVLEAFLGVESKAAGATESAELYQTNALDEQSVLASMGLEIDRSTGRLQTADIADTVPFERVSDGGLINAVQPHTDAGESPVGDPDEEQHNVPEYMTWADDPDGLHQAKLRSHRHRKNSRPVRVMKNVLRSVLGGNDTWGKLALWDR